jgi:hypothetical protein
MKFLSLPGWLLAFCAGVTGAYAQKGPALPSVKPDTVIKQAGTLMRQQVKDVLPGASLQQLTQGVKLFEGSKPITVSKLAVEADYNYFQDTSGMGLGIFHNMAGTFSYTVDYGVGLSGMPFNMSIRESNGINTMDYTPFRNFYQFNFDHTKYLETLRSKLLEKLSPDAIMNAALSRVKTIRMQYEQQLQGEIGKIQSEYTKEYKMPMAVPTDASHLSPNDMAALRNRLLPGTALQKYQQNMAIVQNMIQNKDPKTLATDSSYHKALGEVKKYEAMESIYSKVTTYKQRYENNPLVKQLLSTSSFTPGALKTYLSDPNNLGQVLDDQASLSAMQKLFYNIKTLNTGQNAAQTGDLGLSNLVNTGANAEFQNKSASVGMVYGRNSNVNNWQQAGLTSAITNEYSNLTGFKVGTGTGSSIDQSLAINFFHFNNNNGGAPGASAYLPMAPRQDGVISLHTGMPLGGSHNITLDVSKSFGSFQNTGGDSAGGKTASNGSLFNNAGKANYAGILSYTGEIAKTDVKLYLKKVGLGYNNPGNALLRSGESQLGLGLARKFLGQRLSIKYDGDYRRQVFDPYSNFIYTAFTNKMQTGFRIDRNDRVTLTYQRSDYQSDFYGKAPVTGVNSLLQLNANYRFVIDRKKVMNTLIVSRQEMTIPFSDTSSAYSNTSVLITNTSSFMAGKNLISLTILDNQSSNKTYYFNTSMFSAEASCSYTLSALRMSSALGYYDNAGWNTQLGIRQQLSATLKEKVNVDLQLGYKKAIHIIQPQLANQLFVSTGVRYTFK